MTIHEFGKENRETILLIHPSVVRWTILTGDPLTERELPSDRSGTSGIR